MGLDVTHDCWSGAYSAFTRWRNKIAAVAGYQIMPVKYENGLMHDTIMIDWGHIESDNPGHLDGEWNTAPADPLIILIAHQDCEGIIKPEHAGPLADRLESLLPALEGLHDPGHIGNYVEKTRSFIDGLRLAVSRGENVEFH